MSDVASKLRNMKAIALHKSIEQGGRIEYLREIEEKLDLIAMAKLNEMSNINTNLLGLSYLLLAEVKRLREFPT